MRIYRMIKDGYSAFDIMAQEKLTQEELEGYLDRYRNIASKEAAIETLDETFLKCWFEMMKLTGEVHRNSCDRYNDDSGTCNRYKASEFESAFRNKYPGVLKTVNRMLRLNVREHPEICSGCEYVTPKV